MANRFYHWVDCKECDGTAKVWHQNPGSKYKKAKEFGVKIINESEFKKLLGK